MIRGILEVLCMESLGQLTRQRSLARHQAHAWRKTNEAKGLNESCVIICSSDDCEKLCCKLEVSFAPPRQSLIPQTLP